MPKLIPFLCLSLVLHSFGFVALAKLITASTGIAGLPDGDPDRVFVCVVADKDVTAVAPVPSPVDTPTAIETKKVEEPQTPEESQPEVLAVQEPEVPTEFYDTPVEETPEPNPQLVEPEKPQEQEKEESPASTPQVASDVQKRRAALGQELRDFQSLILAAVRQASFFPHEAVRKKRHGQVTVRFMINREGKLISVEVVETSGSTILDEAAKKIIQKAAAKFPLPPSGLDRDTLDYTVPILFREKRFSRSSRSASAQ